MLTQDRKNHLLDFVKICCIESSDGIHWQRPNPGLVEFDGSKENTIVITHTMFPGMLNLDNFFVRLDVNLSPACSGRFKACMEYACLNDDGKFEPKLVSILSDDGYHFDLLGEITRKGRFDTLNAWTYLPETGKYCRCIRSFHGSATKEDYTDAPWI